MSGSEKSAPGNDAPQWEEPQTGPGFTINDGYDFGWVTRVVESLSGKRSR